MIFRLQANLLVSRMGRSIVRRMTSQVWYRDDSDKNLYEPHVTNPPQYLTPRQLLKKTAVTITKVDKSEDEAAVAKIQKDGGYNYFDVLEVSRRALPDFEQRMKKFYAEHLHKDDEVRLVFEGSGFFEVRDVDDKWIRLQVSKGDMIFLPAGMYHRLTLDPAEFLKMYRLFTDEPKWRSINRPEGDSLPARTAYMQSLRSNQK